VREVSEGVVSFRSSAASFSTVSAASRGGRARLGPEAPRGSRQDLTVREGWGRRATSAGAPRRPARQRSWSTGRSREGGTTASTERWRSRDPHLLAARGARERLRPRPETCLPRRIEIEVTARLLGGPASPAAVAAGESASGSRCASSSRREGGMRSPPPARSPSRAPARAPSRSPPRRSSSSRGSSRATSRPVPHRGRSPGGGRRPGARVRYTAPAGRDRRGADGSVDRSYPDCHQVESCPE